jgi:hypothetical protein
MRILLLFQCLIIGILSYAQTDFAIDSLKQNIEKSRFSGQGLDIETIKIICKYYEFKSKDSTVKFAKLLETTGRNSENADAIFTGSLLQNNRYFYSG